MQWPLHTSMMCVYVCMCVCMYACVWGGWKESSKKIYPQTTNCLCWSHLEIVLTKLTFALEFLTCSQFPSQQPRGSTAGSNQTAVQFHSVLSDRPLSWQYPWDMAWSKEKVATVIKRTVTLMTLCTCWYLSSHQRILQSSIKISWQY